MTDIPEFDQQKLVKSPKNNNPTGKGGFKPGFDKRRWVNGRGKKSPEQKEGEEILLAVYWKELSRVFDAASGKPIEPEEELTALELAVRNQIKKDFRAVADRIAGKVETPIKHSGEMSMTWKDFINLDSDPDAQSDNQ